MFPWNKRTITQIPSDFPDTGKLSWCRSASVVHIDGTGALRWENGGPAKQPTVYDDRLLWLTLRGTPLLAMQSPGCPTCESLLATGWGMDTADCPELEAVRETLNGGFARLEDAVSALAPLLGLLPAGLYVLADTEIYPADGAGRFFWDVPDALTVSPATAAVELVDDDHEFVRPESAPVFVYPTQRRSRFDPARAEFYTRRLREDGPLPRGLALYVGEGMSVLLDGHHKAAAAALLGRTLPCLTIFPMAGYRYQNVLGVGRKPVRDGVLFGPFTIPLGELPAKWLPEPKSWWKHPQNKVGWKPEGRLADRTWPEEYRAAGARYPTQKEYGLVTAAEIGYPTDQELAEWLELHWEASPKLRAALVLLRAAGDVRLKEVALRCAAISNRYSSLKEEAFRVLAQMHGDPEAEAFFVEYFVALDENHGTDHLTKIAHSFWE